MATKKAQVKTEEVEKARVADLPRFQQGEMGYVGLKQVSGITQEELKRELNFPDSMTTYKQMSYHSSIAAALNLFEIMVGKVTWTVTPPPDATEEEKRQCRIIEESMDDMDHSWDEFIQEVMSMKTYGFAVHEKVYRRRNKASGSKYDDGVISWRKLPIRSQDTIDEFIFSDDGRELLGVQQNLGLVEDRYGRFSSMVRGKEIVIPRAKFMLFRTGKQRGNPFGVSPLRNCYFAWKYLTQIEETEAVGVARDLTGMPCLKIPPQYMSADATPDQKAIYEYYKNVIRNIQMNQQSGLILPQAFDPETKQPLFVLELLKVEGGKSVDTEPIKEYYKNLILTALFADMLILGQSQTGSYALGSLKQSLVGVAIQKDLEEIKSTLNRDLIRQTYELNGWDTSRMCSFDYDHLQDTDMEAVSKFWQRIASVGLVERDREVLNSIRVAAGIDPLPADMEVQQDLLTGATSRAGDGMEKGAGNGTSDNVAGTDNSSLNQDNAS